MMDMQTLLDEFLNNLESITDNELFAELEKAKRDSQDSFLLDEEYDSTVTVEDTDVSPVIVVSDSAISPNEALLFSERSESIHSVKTATTIFSLTSTSTSPYSYCSNFGATIGADLWKEGSAVA